MTSHDQCDRDRLQQLFNESLPETVANAVADHVATCPRCQSELESLAGEQTWWVEASRRLSQSSAEVLSLGIQRNGRNTLSNPLLGRNSSDSLGSRDSGPPREWNSDDLSDEVYASDFAVDFLEPSNDASVLGRLGEYEIVEVIGRGGMGIVLKGFQKELNRFVAVKVLAPHLATSGAARRRFEREAQATAAVVNPHVMAIHSVHANSRLPYLVMPFVDCESLQQRLDRQGQLDVKEILRIGFQAALGLAAAHAQGIVHRDVKPANILLETNVDRVMLTDFGLARAVDDATLTRTGIIAGTPQYMSPEQANGDAIDHRSDLFSLGSVLYAMCTSRPPFRAETTFGVLRRIRETDPRPIREINPDIPSWLERIVFNLLSKHSESRIATAMNVARLLEQCLAHVQQPTIVDLPDEWKHAPRQPEVVQKKSTTSLQQSGRWWLLMTVLVSAAFIIARPWVFQTKSPTETPAAMTANPLFDWNESQIELNQTNQSLHKLETSIEADSDPDSSPSPLAPAPRGEG